MAHIQEKKKKRQVIDTVWEETQTWDLQLCTSSKRLRELPPEKRKEPSEQCLTKHKISIQINKVLKEANGDPGVKKHNDGKEKFNKGAQQENWIDRRKN